MAYINEDQLSNRFPGLIVTELDETVTRNSTSGGSDSLAHSNVKAISGVNDTTKGAQSVDNPDYALTTDYLLTSDKVDWSPASSQPNANAIYYVTYTFYANGSGATGVTSAITRATSIVDGYLRTGGYAPPVYSTATSPDPGSVQDYTLTLAVYDLAAEVYGEVEIPEALRDRRDWVMGELEKIAMGRMLLVKNDGTELSKTQVLESTTDDYHPTFDIGDIEDMVPDPDLLDAIADEKD